MIDGYILSTDFFKFRGRGLIQTTWRNNYAKLVDFVQHYDGDHPVVASYSDKWKDTAPDGICTVSTNEDWDSLFSEESRTVMCAAIKLHAQKTRYAVLSEADDILNGAHAGSLIFMGNSIGGKGYGERLKARVGQICRALEGNRE